MENLYTTDCIRTFSGKYINVFEPTPEMICIEDIAHSLSNQCRFGGHLPEFYSVAQHSVMCAKNVAPEFRLEALLHDASEAYLLDIPKPIKNGLPQYKKIEDRLMEVIAKKYGISFPFHKEIKNVDCYMLEYEWHFIMMQHPKPEDFVCWSQQKAKEIFTQTFYELTKSLENN